MTPSWRQTVSSCSSESKAARRPDSKLKTWGRPRRSLARGSPGNYKPALWWLISNRTFEICWKKRGWPRAVPSTSQWRQGQSLIWWRNREIRTSIRISYHHSYSLNFQHTTRLRVRSALHYKVHPALPRSIIDYSSRLLISRRSRWIVRHRGVALSCRFELALLSLRRVPGADSLVHLRQHSMIE